MKLYIGTKKLFGKPMNRVDYCEYRGWTLPADENGADEGYLVEYTDGGAPNHKNHKGYISWSPKNAFESAYRLVDGMLWGLAIEALKNGLKVARHGWNGKGMFVVLQKGYPQGIPCNKQTAIAWGLNEGDLFIVQPYFQIKNVDGSHSMWVPSINDNLAEDYYIVE